jgi:hypothetical protein
MEDAHRSPSDLLCIDEEFVASIMAEHRVDSFHAIQSVIKEVALHGSRNLTKEERRAISCALHSSAEQLRTNDSIFAEHMGVDEQQQRGMTSFLLVTAYSDDYRVGYLSEQVNRAYASKHQYPFHSVKLPAKAMLSAVAPKQHCAWYKILLLRSLLADRQFLDRNQVGYLMWIDADAIIVDHSKPLHTVVAQAAERDLIIAEDMNVGCLLNSGIFLVRTSEWSVGFLDDVWQCSQYDAVPFYEQSSIIRCLRRRSEWIHRLQQPFHSFALGGPPDPKLFAHVAVLPIRYLNSNRGVTCRDIEQFRAAIIASETPPGDDHLDSCHPVDTTSTTCRCYLTHGNYCSICSRGVDFRPVAIDHLSSIYAVAAEAPLCEGTYTSVIIFAYHPAGMADKELLIQTAIWRYGLGDGGP